jgi:putative ATP-binding cassette transporter
LPFGQVMGAFSLIVSKYQELSTFAAVVNRLGAMWEATASAGTPAAEAGASRPTEKEKEQPRDAKPEGEEPAQPRIEKGTDDRRIAYEKLTLWTPPSRRVLIRDLSLEAPEGTRLLVSGPDGSGKTALCLATAGLWGAGQGKVIRPDPSAIMFLPQRIYMVAGKLRDLLLYGLEHDQITDEELRGALEDVGLGSLARQAEGLDQEWNWSNDLSPGDRHALALARLLLAKPRFAVLDGVPWSLGPTRLKRLYGALARSSITYISAGGPADLQPYHDLWLELYGDGRWRLRRTGSADGADTENKEWQTVNEHMSAGGSAP